MLLCDSPASYTAAEDHVAHADKDSDIHLPSYAIALRKIA